MMHTDNIGRPQLECEHQVQRLSSWYMERVGFQENAGFTDVACGTANRSLPGQGDINVDVNKLAFR